jgi:hypothetical protein
MAAKHGTRRRYSVEGCRCADCKEAQRIYCAELRQRHANGEVMQRRVTVTALPAVSQPIASGPGPVERGVTAEISGLTQAELQPALAEIALALARVLDSPRAVSSHPAAAKVMADILDRLHKGAARTHRGGLKVVRAMTETPS